MKIRLESALVCPWRIEDAEELAAAANNRAVWLTLRDSFPHPYTREDAEAYLSRAVAADPPGGWCIEVDRHVAGGIGVHAGVDVYHRSAEIGYWLAAPFWGRGIMTGVVRGVVRHAFASRPLERIEAHVFANNPASARVLEKVGFTCEGRLRRSVVKDGQVLDSLVYAILRDDLRE